MSDYLKSTVKDYLTVQAVSVVKEYPTTELERRAYVPKTRKPDSLA